MHIKPKRLKKGDTIGIIAPASPFYNKSELFRAVNALENLGYKIILGRNVLKKNEYLAGTDTERAADINEMFANEEVDAIFVTQGGYGSARTLRYLDFETIKANPKIFIGFSDITSLHLAIHKNTGMVTFHGPGAGSFIPGEMTEYKKEYFFKALASDQPIGEIKKVKEDDYIHVINPGLVSGELIGGNLSLICATLGTPYEIDTKNKILFFEEIDTEPWTFDHLMTHLYNAGKLSDAAGIVIGDCVQCEPFKHHPGFPVTFSIEDILEEFIKPLKKPAIYGLPIGHTKDRATLPIGVKATLNAAEGKLCIDECGTI